MHVSKRLLLVIAGRIFLFFTIAHAGELARSRAATPGTIENVDAGKENEATGLGPPGLFVGIVCMVCKGNNITLVVTPLKCSLCEFVLAKASKGNMIPQPLAL